MTEANEKIVQNMSSLVKQETIEANSSSHNAPQKIERNAEFSSFLELRSAIDRYQKENSVQLIVKDSKLLKAESTRKIIPKVYHLVNQNLMYHSITYCCKCHGELKQKPGTRIKNVGQKRLNCPMYIRFKLSPDLQKLMLFDIEETHNHDIDPTTFQMTPRQQVYKLSRMRRNGASINDNDEDIDDTNGFSTNVSKYGTDSEYEPPRKSARIQAKQDEDTSKQQDEDGNESDTDGGFAHEEYYYKINSPLDSESSCSDSDEEEILKNRALLPFPIRLIGSAIQSSPELIAAAKQLIQIQKSKLIIEKQKLILENKQLELVNSKLELELRVLERNLAAEMNGSSEGRDTTIYLQAT